MKLRNLTKTLALSAVASAMLVGCGSSDSGSSSTTQTGTFVDAPVYGLKYSTATQSGYTDANGTFKYVDGETVEFKLGNLSLGNFTGQALVTPYNLAGDTNISNPSDKAKNIAMLLQNFDLNRSNTSVLDISKLKDFDFSDVNLSATTNDMETKIQNVSSDIIAHASFGASFLDTNTSLINATIAQNVMKSFINANSTKYDKKFTQDYLDGKSFYAIYDWGEDSENWDGTSGWSLIKEQFLGTSHTFNEWRNGSYQADETEPYVIENGKIKVTSTNEVYTQEIIAIDDDKITIWYGDSSGYDYFYFDETKAKRALLAKTKKYTQDYLDNEGVVYSLYQDHDNNNAWTVTTIKFSGGNVYADEGSFTDNPTDTDHTYTIESGAIKEVSGGDQWFNTIVNVTDDYIYECTLESLNASCGANSNVYVYFDKAKAQAKLAELQGN